MLAKVSIKAMERSEKIRNAPDIFVCTLFYFFVCTPFLHNQNAFIGRKAP